MYIPHDFHILDRGAADIFSFFCYWLFQGKIKFNIEMIMIPIYIRRALYRSSFYDGHEWREVFRERF